MADALWQWVLKHEIGEFPRVLYPYGVQGCTVGEPLLVDIGKIPRKTGRVRPAALMRGANRLRARGGVDNRSLTLGGPFGSVAL